MRIILPLLAVVLLTACGTNRNVYKSSEFAAKAYQHHTIAILPLKITQTGHVSKKETRESIDEANEKWSYVFQESLLSYALKHTSKNRKAPIISFQSVQKTNAILKEAGLDINAMYDKKPEELANLLKVDAVILTTLEKDKNFSDGVAYGLAAGRAVLGAINKTTMAPNGLYANAADINMNSYLYDAADSKLLWKTFRKGGTDLPSNINGLVEYYSNWIAKKLPYRS